MDTGASREGGRSRFQPVSGAIKGGLVRGSLGRDEKQKRADTVEDEHTASLCRA